MNDHKLVLSATVVGTGLLLLYLYKRRVRRNRAKNLVKNRLKNNVPVGNWEYVGFLEQIITYPIKSCGATELFWAKCGLYGLESNGFRDRLLIMFDEDDYVGFAGRHPKMLQIESDIICEGILLVYAPNMEPLNLEISRLIKGGREVFKAIDGVCVPLIECVNAEIETTWFSRFLLGKETGIRLYVRVTPEREEELIGENNSLNPFMAITDESVANLNARLSNKVHHLQFRANFLISSHLPAFAEDNWKWMRIGHDATFKYKAPCYRCILPNIDPFTSERSQDFEPLKTLKRFRMRTGQNEPEMGIYFDLHTEGKISVGDPVYVIT